MYYIFNENGNFIGTSDYEPNLEDLRSRAEYFVICNEDLIKSRVVGGKYGGIYECVETPDEILQKSSFNVAQDRDTILNKTDWITTRHFEEKMLGKETTLSDIQIAEFLEYRQALRDITKLEDFPFISLPQQPSFLE